MKDFDQGLAKCQLTSDSSTDQQEIVTDFSRRRRSGHSNSLLLRSSNNTSVHLHNSSDDAILEVGFETHAIEPK